MWKETEALNKKISLVVQDGQRQLEMIGESSGRVGRMTEQVRIAQQSGCRAAQLVSLGGCDDRDQYSRAEGKTLIESWLCQYALLN